MSRPTKLNGYCKNVGLKMYNKHDKIVNAVILHYTVYINENIKKNQLISACKNLLNYQRKKTKMAAK